MSLSIPDFWKLVIESRLLTPEQCQSLVAEFENVKGAANQGNVKTLVQWLIAQNALTKYQAIILEAGRSGPFHYGDYKVYDRIEKGPTKGFFRAIHEPTSHPVLLKFVTGEATSNRAKWVKLVETFKKHQSVVHAHVSRCHEAVDLTTYKFVALEDLAGQPLNERLGEGRALRPADACRLVRQAAQGVAAIHQAGLVHGDIRPANLWIDSAGSIKLRRDPLDEHVPLYMAQTDAASPLHARADYMAPELAQQGKLPDVLTDVYALGCTLYQLLTGQPPFSGGDVMQKMSRHATEPIKPLEQFGVPPQVAQLVAYMMAKNSNVRYQQAAVVAEQVAQFVDPAQLNLRPAAPPRSLASYETWVKQKQSTLSAHRPAAVPTFVESFPKLGESGGVAVAAAPIVQSATATATRVSSVPVTDGTKPAMATRPGKTSNVSARIQGKKLSKKNWIMIGSSVGGAIVFGLILLIAMNANSGGGTIAKGSNGPDGNPDKTGTDDPDAKPDSVNVSDPATDNGASDVNAEGSSGNNSTSQEVSVVNVPDDGKVLWAPPTAGPPINIDYVPPALRILIAARPAAILESSVGEEVLKAIGPRFEAGRASWEKMTGVGFAEIEQVLVGFHDNPMIGDRPISSYTVRLKTSLAEADLVARWGSPGAAVVPDVAGKVFSTAEGWAYFVPPPDGDEGVTLFIMAPESLAIESAKQGKLPPVLRKQMTDLLRFSDDQRHFTILFSPNTLLNDEGQKLFSGDLAKVLDPLDRLMGPGILAATASLHFGGEFYFEMRLQNDGNIENYKLASEIQGRLEQVPKELEAYIDLINPPPYWRSLARRFPLQIGFLHDYMRIGVEEDHAVINSVLPIQAAPNMLAAGELVIASTPGAATVVAVATNDKPVPKSYAELLEVKYDIEMPSNDMILIMQGIQDDIRNTYKDLPFPFEIKILGNDLKPEGITQNQRAEVKLKGQSFSDVMTAIVMKANPVTTVKDPSEIDQKLIWVIGPDPDTGKEMLLITTRTAATAKNYTLPKPFQPKSP